MDLTRPSWRLPAERSVNDFPVLRRFDFQVKKATPPNSEVQRSTGPPVPEVEEKIDSRSRTRPLALINRGVWLMAG